MPSDGLPTKVNDYGDTSTASDNTCTAIAYARNTTTRRVPRMPRHRRFALSVLTPLIIGLMARIMLSPPGSMIRAFRIPGDVVREVYVDNPETAAQTRDSVARTRELCTDLGMMNPISRRLWRAMGIWDEPKARARSKA
ncbi:diiron oxygenase [Microbispora sp. H10836]|uniref:diiron oxygenase n=1 Tax=Microbispora sp. H10836 TaxID=2729106 RepID=UPI002892E98D|nr:diiron oxygenase [Microbispora sp. H10836]